MVIPSVLNHILSWIFSINCVHCGVEDTWLCSTCFSRIPRHIHVVPHLSPLNGVWAITAYDDPIVTLLLHYLKYNGIRAASEPLGALLTELFAQIDNFPVRSILYSSSIIPIPLHPRRLRERGFNQSALLAHHLSTRCHRPTIPEALKRIRYTTPQAQLNRAERLHNIDDAFSTGPDFKKLNKNVILIDDVATTTATLAACATILKTHGIHTVWGLVIAHGN